MWFKFKTTLTTNEFIQTSFMALVILGSVIVIVAAMRALLP